MKYHLHGTLFFYRLLPVYGSKTLVLIDLVVEDKREKRKK